MVAIGAKSVREFAIAREGLGFHVVYLRDAYLHDVYADRRYAPLVSRELLFHQGVVGGAGCVYDVLVAFVGCWNDASNYKLGDGQMLRTIPTLLAVGLLGACSNENAVADADAIVQAGCYYTGFEASSFVPLPPKDTESWWVINPPESFGSQLLSLAGDKLGRGDRFSVAVKIRGILSKPGRYGHMGIADREVQILSFSDMRVPAEGQPCSISLLEKSVLKSETTPQP